MCGLNYQPLLLFRVALLLLLVCSEPKVSKRRNNHVVSGSNDKKNVVGGSQIEGGRTTKRTETNSAKRHEKYFSIASDLKKRTRASIQDRTLISYNLSTIDQLTITSLVYNPTSHTSTWVDKLFGDKAIYYLKTDYEAEEIYKTSRFFNMTSQIPSKEPLTDKEIDLRFHMFRDVFKLPYYAIQPACSFEALGFVLLRDDGPFMPDDRNKPFIGNALIQLPERKTFIRCFYRFLFENWRSDKPISDPNYWTLIFYCPAETTEQCDYLDWTIKKHKYYVPGKVDVQGKEMYEIDLSWRAEKGNIKLRTPPYNGTDGKMKTDVWTSSFVARPFVSVDPFLFKNYTTPRSILEGMTDDKDVKGISPTFLRTNQAVLNQNTAAVASSVQQASAGNQGHIPLAACLVIPYTSTDTQKSLANGAMLLEWIRYHAQLGFKLLIYDRDGANEEHIYHSYYGAAQRIRIPKEGKLVYHPYTIRGLLDPNRKGIRYDNTDAGFDYNDTDPKRGSFEAQGHDKVLTLTHCRFEAKAVYNIENVMVIDFDEFLHCPVVNPTAKAQSDFIHHYLQHLKLKGIEQVEFAQRVVGNKTMLSPRDCVVNKAIKHESLFDCFSSYEFYNGAHSIKCIHLNHGCPLTGYHQACPSVDVPRTHDCLCSTILVRSNNFRSYVYPEFKRDLSRRYEVPLGRECAVVHLSTNVGRDYAREEYAFDEKQQRGIAVSTSELYYIANSRILHNPANEKRVQQQQQQLKQSRKGQKMNGVVSKNSPPEDEERHQPGDFEKEE